VKNKLALASLGLAFSAAVLLLVLPTGVAEYNGLRRTTTLLQSQGSWAIVATMVPVVFALLPLIFPKQAIRIIAAVLIGAFAFVGSFSIGLFYVPSGVAMLLAACVSDSAKFRDAFW
jgi:hypothetical protein